MKCSLDVLFEKQRLANAHTNHLFKDGYSFHALTTETWSFHEVLIQALDENKASL